MLLFNMVSKNKNESSFQSMMGWSAKAQRESTRSEYLGISKNNFGQCFILCWWLFSLPNFSCKLPI